MEALPLSARVAALRLHQSHAAEDTEAGARKMQISASCLLAREEFRDMWFRAARTACSASCSSGTKSCDCVKQVVQSRNPGGPVGARRLVPWEFTVLHCSGGARRSHLVRRGKTGCCRTPCKAAAMTWQVLADNSRRIRAELRQ